MVPFEGTISGQLALGEIAAEFDLVDINVVFVIGTLGACGNPLAVVQSLSEVPQHQRCYGRFSGPRWTVHQKNFAHLHMFDSERTVPGG
jgi:hypothetical protein